MKQVRKARRKKSKQHKHARILVHLKDSANQFVMEHGGSPSPAVYEMWVASIRPKDPKVPWDVGVDYPIYNTFRSWYSHSKPSQTHYAPSTKIAHCKEVSTS